MSNRYVSTIFSTGEEFEEFLSKLDAFKKGVEDGTIVIPNASSATKATQDSDGNAINTTYAKKADLTSGTIKVKSAASADNAGSATSAGSATKATQDSDGNQINTTYAKKADLTSGTVKVKSATSADSAGSATKATQDSDGNAINATYAKTADLTSGTIKVKSATSADSATSATSATSAGSATKATQDSDGNAINTTYAKTTALEDGTLEVKTAQQLRQPTLGRLTVKEGVLTLSSALESNRLYVISFSLNDEANYFYTVTMATPDYGSTAYYYSTVARNGMRCSGSRNSNIISFGNSEGTYATNVKYAYIRKI